MPAVDVVVAIVVFSPAVVVVVVVLLAYFPPCFKVIYSLITHFRFTAVVGRFVVTSQEIIFQGRQRNFLSRSHFFRPKLSRLFLSPLFSHFLLS